MKSRKPFGQELKWIHKESARQAQRYPEFSGVAADGNSLYFSQTREGVMCPQIFRHPYP